MSRTHSVFEHQLLVKEDFVFSTDFLWLIHKIETKEIPCFTLTVVQSQIAVKASHYIVVLRLPSGILLEILPKIEQHRRCSNNAVYNNTDQYEDNARMATRIWLSQMFSDLALAGSNPKTLPFLANSQNVFTHTNRTAKEKNTWLHMIVDLWMNAVKEFQPFNQYQHQHTNHPNAKGKLLIKQQLKHNSLKPHYRYTKEQQFRSSEMWGRLFYTVELLLISLGVTLSQALHQKIKLMRGMSSQLCSEITAVLPLPIYQVQTTITTLLTLIHTNQHQGQINSINARYGKLAVQLSRLILNIDENADISSPIHNGNDFVPAVMMDMNLAFEQWVSYKLSQTHKHTSTQTQHHWLTGRGETEWPFKETKRVIQPDFLILDNENQVKVVVDIKYKHINTPQQVNSKDLYQVFAYLAHFNAKEAWLVFPKTETFQCSYEFYLKNNLNASNCLIKILPFDLVLGKVIL